MENLFLILISASLGGFLGSLATLIYQQKQELRRIKLDVFAEFIDGVAEAAHTNNSKPSLTKISQAKTKVSLIASSNVIKAMGYFFKNETNLENKNSMMNFAQILNHMRRELKISKPISSEEIKILIFN
jgi:hypothetical protein